MGKRASTARGLAAAGGVLLILGSFLRWVAWSADLGVPGVPASGAYSGVHWPVGLLAVCWGFVLLLAAVPRGEGPGIKRSFVVVVAVGSATIAAALVLLLPRLEDQTTDSLARSVQSAATPAAVERALQVSAAPGF